jgi:GntR family transcriptional repressor for pyruvate dehydrogenase complex
MTSDQIFDELSTSDTLANQLIDQIEALISVSQLRPGDRLPTERELAHKFGVSRTVVREAVRALAAKGLLEVKRGSGTTIRAPSAQSVSHSILLYLRAGQPEIDYRKVMEVRFHLEIEIAGLAAERHSQQDVEKMGRILIDTPLVDSREAFVIIDMAFHTALAEATRNPLYVLLLESIAGIMRKVRELAYDIPKPTLRAYKHHAAILEQVKAGNRDGARRAMRDHLYEAEDTIQQALATYALRSPDTD